MEIGATEVFTVPVVTRSGVFNVSIGDDLVDLILAARDLPVRACEK